MKQKKIIAVDDNAVILTIYKNILRPRYEVYTASSAAKMFVLMEKVMPDLILLDVEMPEMNGYETALVLKGSDEFKEVPFIFVSAERDAKSEMEGLNQGALDYIFKPFVNELLLRRVETHLSLINIRQELKALNTSMNKIVIAKTDKLWKIQNAVLSIVADLVECRDGVTGGHVSRTQKYLSCLIEKLLEKGVYGDKISSWNMDFALPSAQLHDVGKIGISDAILNKPGKLTDEEFEIIKTHVKIGVAAITRMEQATEDHSFFRHAKVFAGTHHERWDGKGYPNGLAGIEIPLEGRLMAIADVYDALISARPYKKALSYPEAEEIIIDGRGNHFDPQLIDVFSKVSDKFAEIAREWA
ncbi:MAG: response regulator [Firmicutes bacterium]|nr:response regulator [Bacillota bacterium]